MVEGTFEMYKIETKRVQPPLKLLVYYQNLERKSDRDLQIYYSYSNQKPDETNCDGKASLPSVTSQHVFTIFPVDHNL